MAFCLSPSSSEDTLDVPRSFRPPLSATTGKHTASESESYRIRIRNSIRARDFAHPARQTFNKCRADTLEVPEEEIMISFPNIRTAAGAAALVATIGLTFCLPASAQAPLTYSSWVP